MNSWGYVTYFGLVRGLNTSGGAEAWIDGQILYYNPNVPGTNINQANPNINDKHSPIQSDEENDD